VRGIARATSADASLRIRFFIALLLVQKKGQKKTAPEVVSGAVARARRYVFWCGLGHARKCLKMVNLPPPPGFLANFGGRGNQGDNATLRLVGAHRGQSSVSRIGHGFRFRRADLHGDFFYVILRAAPLSRTFLAGARLAPALAPSPSPPDARGAAPVPPQRGGGHRGPCGSVSAP
jgi:hypothetical protein